MTNPIFDEEEKRYADALRSQGKQSINMPAAKMDEEEQLYADVLKQRTEQRQEVLRQSLLQAVKDNPEQRAQIENLSKQTGIAQDVVERNLADIITQRRTQELQDAAKFSPILSEQLSNPNFASVAFDDTPSLSTLEQVLTKGRDYVGSLGKGVIGQGVGTTLSGFGELYGVATRQLEGLLDQVLPNSAMSFLRTPIPWYLSPQQILQRPGEELKDFGKILGAPQARQGLDTDVIEGIGQLGFQIAAHLVTGGTSSTAMLTAQGADIMAEKTKEDKAPQAAKDSAIIVGAGITALTERIGLDAILNRVPPEVRNRTLRFIADKAAAFGIEFAQEVTEGLLHDLTRRVFTNESAPILEGALREGTAAGLAAAIVRTALGVRGYRAASEQEEFFKALADNSTNSKLRERVPERFRELMERLTESGPVQNVYIPADQFRTFYQSQGINPAAKAAEFGAKNYDEAAAAGTDIVIPMSEFVTRLAPTDDLQGLSQDLRLSQGDLTAREFAAFQADQEARMAEIEAQAQAIMGEAQSPAFEQIKQGMVGQLVGTGYEQNTADAYATVYAKTITNLAERAGMDPIALHERYSLTVNRPLPEVLTRNPAGGDIQIDPLLDRLRAGDLPSEQEVFGASLVEFIRQRGGIQPYGELTDADADRRPFQRNLVQPEGMTADEAAMRAVEAGYFPGAEVGQVTEAELFNALDDELRGGQATYAETNVNPQLFDLRNQLLQLDDYLRQLGIDLMQIADNAQVRQLLEQAAGQEGDGPALFQQDQTDTPGFLAWSKGHPVVPLDAGQVFEAGEPVVVEALHGTTGDFDTFDRSRANIESDLGAGFYFSNTPDEIGANYAGLGPDLTAELERLTEQLEQNLEDDPSMVDADADQIRQEAERRAREQFMANEGFTMPVYVRFDNPAVLGGDRETFLDYNEAYDEESDEYGEPTGALVRLMEAIREVEQSGDFEMDADTAIGALQEGGIDYNGMKATEAIEALKKALVYAVDYNTGDSATNEIVRQAFERAGFDGFIDQTVDKKFGSQRRQGQQMQGMNPDTVHFIAFYPNQIASRIGSTWERNNTTDSILYQRASKRDDYTVDMFGVPTGNRADTSAEGSANGRRARKLSRDDAPGTFATQTQVVEENQRTLGTSQVNTPEEAAQALAYLSRNAVERFDALITDAEGTPLAIVGAFKGALSQASVYPATLAGEAFRIEGAANIWFAHNHPSGNPVLSRADLILNDALANVFTGSEIRPRGILAIGGKDGDGRKWSFAVNSTDSAQTGTTTKPSSEIQVPVVERVLAKEDKLGPTINSPQAAKSIAKDIAGGQSGVVLMDAQNTPVGFVPVDPVAAGELRTDGRMDALWRALSVSNAGAAIIVNNGAYTERQILNLSGFFGASDTRVLDVMEIAGDRVTSYAESGVSFTSSTFRQGQDMDDKRGFIQFGANRKFNITLLEKADLSTFLHESGHFYLEVLGDLAEMPEASQQIKGDYATILKFLGAKSRADITLDGKTPGSAEYQAAVNRHEQFARANEAYLMEGKAPSEELRSIFQRFKSWLKLIYREFSRLNVELTNDVRAVFDRIYATDQEIEAAKADMSMAPLFLDAASAGMTEAEFEAYKQSVAQATERGKEALQAKVMRELQREREAWYKDELEKMRATVAAEVDAQPVYQAFKQLTEGDIKLNKDELVERYGAEYVKRLPRGFQRVYTRGEGMPLDMAAQVLNFPNGDAMVEALVGMRPRNELIRAEADARMKELYGDMILDGTIADEAKLALHNAQREQVLAAELRALRRKQREVAPFLQAERQAQAAQRRQARAATDVPPAEAFRAAARGIVGQTAIRDLEPARYLNAQRRLGRQAFEAMSKGDYMLAAEAKQKELLNHYLYLEAREARERADKVAKHMRDLEKREAQERLGKAGKTYLDQVNAILDGYEFRRIPNRQIDRRGSLLEFTAQQEAEGNPVNIPLSVLEDARQINYRQLTADELDAIYEAVRNIENLARLKNKLTLIAEKRELDEVASEAIEHIQLNAKGGKAKKLESNLPGEQLGRWAKGFMLIHTKFSTLFRQMDGWKDGGMMWNLFVRPLNNRADFEAVQRAEATKKLSELFKTYRDANMFGKKHIPSLGQAMTLQGRLMVALNWGREENRQRLRDGNGFSQQNIDEIFATLEERDWRFVQGVWDLFDSYWPLISDQYERLYGVPPQKSDAAPFQTRYGNMAGGYFPIKYDPMKSERATAFNADEIAQQMKSGAFMRSQTKNGFTKEVLQNVDRAVRLDFSSIYEHLDEVIHDLALREYLLDTNKLLNHRVDGTTLKDVIFDTYGDQFYTEIRDTLRDVAVGDIGARGAFEQAMGHIRAGVTIVGMGWNLMTGLMQPLGLTQSIVRVGPKWIAKGLAKVGTDVVSLNNTAKWIYERSDFMRTRNLTQNREINEIRNQIKRQGKFPLAREVYGMVEDSYFQLIIQGQKIVDIPTWLGAYYKGLEQGADEKGAIALADQAVLDSQSGGAVKDLAKIQRGNPLMKLWTTFYSYFNTTFNLTREAFGKTNFRDPVSIGRLGVDVLMLYTVPAILGYALREVVNMSVGGEEPDDEELIEALIREQLGYVLGTMVGLRELSGFITRPEFGYTGPAGARFFAEATKLAQQVQQGELDAALAKAANNAAGILLHYPAGAVNRAVQGINALAEGETSNPAAILFGPPKQ